MTSPVILYDTTLRDGAQREGLSLTVDDKLKIAGWLDQVGVHYIEGGWPGSNPKDIEFFRRVPELGGGVAGKAPPQHRLSDPSEHEEDHEDGARV